ncbi:MAG TPA: N-acetylmuramoyl-L-alanine amidase [Actinomycetota bacterium]
MGYDLEGAWLRTVNGRNVARRPVSHFGDPWPRGHPIGYLFHYTAGCGSDLSGVLDERGISVHFSVDRAGRIYQYVPVTNVAWHALEASLVYWGVEHSALPGTCDLTNEQLMASARLTAGLVELTSQRWGFDIPLRKTEGPDLVPGFKDHADGTLSTWNDNGHTDHLYRWSWPRYLSQVQEILSGKEEDVLTPEQEDAIKFAQGQLKYLEGRPSPADPGPGRRGWRFAKRVSEAIGEPASTAAVPMTEEPAPAQDQEQQQ